jgi:mannose-6-phosphate isomerase-like protein (cupin superfamily)
MRASTVRGDVRGTQADFERRSRDVIDGYDVLIKRFDEPDELRTFELGTFALASLGGVTVGRATYEPGWVWSTHVGAASHQTSCPVEHVGLVVSGTAGVRMDDGTGYELTPGDLFYVAPGHDSWVIGDEPYVSLHFLGAQEYAAHD